MELLWLYVLQIRWWQYRGKDVICDRYIDDTLLDFQHNFAQEDVAHWWLWKTLCFLAARPRLYFLLLVPVEESVRRSQQKHEPFPDSVETLHWRLAQYERLAVRQQCLVIDGRRPLSEIAESIRKSVDQATSAQASKQTNAH